VDAQIEKILAAVASEIGTVPSLDGTVKIDFGEAGSIFIDGSPPANTVGDGSGKTADSTIALSLETAARLKTHQIDPTMAFFQGKLRVSGDFALAMKVGAILQKAMG
jgi:putative sterol carrier protein